MIGKGIHSGPINSNWVETDWWLGLNSLSKTDLMEPYYSTFLLWYKNAWMHTISCSPTYIATDNKHGTLVSNPAVVAIRSISQHSTLGREPGGLRFYTNLYLGIGGMEPIAKTGPAASKNNQHGTLVCKPARQYIVYPSTANGMWTSKVQSVYKPLSRHWWYGAYCQNKQE